MSKPKAAEGIIFFATVVTDAKESSLDFHELSRGLV